MKKLPKRAASRASFVFWAIIGTFIASWGFLQFIRPDGDLVLGLIAVIGMPLMVAREAGLRKKWKAQQRVVDAENVSA